LAFTLCGQDFLQKTANSRRQLAVWAVKKLGSPIRNSMHELPAFQGWETDWCFIGGIEKVTL